MGERIIFVLGDKLPTIYDVAISIYNVVSKPNSGGMKNCIQAYVTALINVWIKSFGKKHLIIVKILSNMETRWVAEQKTYNTQRILAKIEKGKNQTKYTQKCLQACKSWGGPATTVEELNKILQERSDTAEKISGSTISVSMINC